ncbi:MAG: hypothetical protein LBE51_12300 [Acidovorax sp.]|jgi:hypothetical protein|nr:hypothetical protein [Acidovorax sp.]
MPHATAPSPRFAEALHALAQLRAQLVEELKQGQRDRLAHKLQLDDAIACLQWCEAHSITASAKVTQLPETRTRTPSSEYRIVEDHETEDRSIWTELQQGSQPLRPSPGMLLVDAGLWPD